MLKKFEVSGYKNFKEKFTLDFSDVRDYRFNEECVRNKLLNKILIYGKNGVGKTNFTTALYDIYTIFSDSGFDDYKYYLNADREKSYAEFHYVFTFDNDEIDYVYHKQNYSILLYEKLYINGEKIIDYDFSTKSGYLEGLKKLAPNLIFEQNDSNLSLIKYTVNNTLSNTAILLRKMVQFVKGMLYISSSQSYFVTGSSQFNLWYKTFIFEGDYLEKFQTLINKAGINEKLIKITDPDGNDTLYFSRKNPIPFFSAASIGTKALYTFFFCLTLIDEVSFFIIDEFDAFYHFELSEIIVELLKKYDKVQTILTTHNTNLMTNRIMRPDCYFIMTNEKLTSLVNATNRELREGHNLEKLYMNGEFDE